VYYHFGSKEGLLAAVLERVGSEWIEHLRALQPAGGDLDSRIAAGIEGWEAVIEHPARPMKLFVSVQLESAHSSEELREVLVRVLDAGRSLIVTAIRETAGDQPDLEVLADQVLGLVQAAALGFHLDADRVLLRRRLEAIGRLVARSVTSTKE
jgi:AcrR family transcriptional regulator